MTDSDLNKLSNFHTKNLQRILKIFWPKIISNEQLLAHFRQDSTETINTRRQWRWIGHVLRKELGNITCTVIHWTPEGKRERQTHEHLVPNSRGRDEDPKPQLVYHTEAGPEQTGVEVLRCCQEA